MKVLDAVYLMDIETQGYCTFVVFAKYNGSSKEWFYVFIAAFEKQFREVRKYDSKLPTWAKAIFSLITTNLTITNKRMVRATGKLDYNDMKRQTQNDFGDNVGNPKDKEEIT